MDKFAYYGIYQRGTCFSDIVQPAEEYPESECIRDEPGRKNVLIVGDSFAAHLFPGLVDSLRNSGYVVSQATKASCSYLTREEDTIPSCKNFREYVISELIPMMQPSLIVYSEQWERTAAHPDLVQRIERAISGFSAADSRIVVAGPTPRYYSAVPKSLVISGGYSKAAGNDTWLPCLDDSVEWNALAQATQSLEVELVRMNGTTQRAAQSSPDGLLCLAATSDGPLHWDFGHLTLAGSEFYGEVLWEDIAARE
jgi:hypothetical protein